MISSRRTIQLLILLAGLTLAVCLSSGLGAGQEAGPAAPGDNNNLYLPLVHKAGSMIYGRVTYGGIAASGVVLELRFYDGSSWSTIMTTSTDGAGKYRFYYMPALAAGQAYLVRYLNNLDQSRLGIWETRQLTSFSMFSVVDLGSFDIANIALASPEYGYEASLPLDFHWEPRPATPSDSYELKLFDNFDHTPTFSSQPQGYTGSFRLASLPSGFNFCNPYYWAVTVNNPDGSWGGSLWAYEVTFYAPSTFSGIYGCVTEGGVPASGIPLELWRYNIFTNEDTNAGDTSTVSNGMFSFISQLNTENNEYYYVRYANNSVSNRLALYETVLTDYQDGIPVHIGDFDIADIALGAPDGTTVILPYDFQWTPRPATATDDYELDLFFIDDAGNPSDPYTYWDNLGYVDHYALSELPYGFNTSDKYYWDVWIYDPFGGFGISHERHQVTFSAASPSAASSDPQGTVGPPLIERLVERLRQRRLESGSLGAARIPTRQHPDYERLRGQK